MNFLQNHWQGIMALLALLVAFGSAVIAFYTFRLQRVHNIKSVKPIVHIGQWDYEDRLIVTLKNCGSGIAIVKRMSVRNPVGETKSCLYFWLPEKLPKKMNYREYWTPATEFVIQPSEIIKLIEVPIDTSFQKQIETREFLRNILQQLTVSIQYEDIYGNQMLTKELTLTHFARTDNVN